MKLDMNSVGVKDLIRLIEMLEKENKELRDMLASYKGRFANVEERDDLLAQY
jgi:hypothetical protein